MQNTCALQLNKTKKKKKKKKKNLIHLFLLFWNLFHKQINISNSLKLLFFKYFFLIELRLPIKHI